MRPFYQYIVLFLFLPVLAACGNDISIDPIPVDGTILAFGDSLTYGTGANPTESYPAILQSLTGRKVINAGIPGEVSSDGLKRLSSALDKHQPDLLILIHGGNDMLRKMNLDNTAANLRSMIKLAQAKNIPVVMMAVPNPTLILSPESLYEEVASDMKVAIEIDAIADIIQYPKNKSDAVHPNAAGYKAMAESLYDLLQESGAIE